MSQLEPQLPERPSRRERRARWALRGGAGDHHNYALRAYVSCCWRAAREHGVARVAASGRASVAQSLYLNRRRQERAYPSTCALLIPAGGAVGEPVPRSGPAALSQHSLGAEHSHGSPGRSSSVRRPWSCSLPSAPQGAPGTRPVIQTCLCFSPE